MFFLQHLIHQNGKTSLTFGNREIVKTLSSTLFGVTSRDLFGKVLWRMAVSRLQYHLCAGKLSMNQITGHR